MRRSKTGSEYPPNWLEIARQVKDQAGWRCERCGHIHAPGWILTVHHLDMNPANCAWWNLAALCQRCHLQIQAKVVMERGYFLDHTEWFKPHAAGYYAFILGLPDHKEYVLNNLQALLDLGQGRVALAPGL